MRYDQTAVFFVRSTKQLRFGVFLTNLSDMQRQTLERNTGAVVEGVAEESPAFYANLLPGDVLIKVNDSNVKNEKHAGDLMGQVSPSEDTAMFTIIRNGKEQSITIKLNKT